MARKSAVTIVSVYPMEKRVEHPYGPVKGMGSYEFVLPAAPANGYSKLVVEDCYQKVYLGENIGFKFELIEAMTIAQALVGNWVSTVVGADSGFGPGVFIAAGDEPTKEELARARENQELYFEYLINQAETKYRANKFEEITDTHRAAAKWMGRENVEWLRQIKRQQMKECPLCFAMIPQQASVCPNCTRDIAPLPKLKAA